MSPARLRIPARASTTADTVVDVASEGVRLPVSATRVQALARWVLRAQRTRHAIVSIAFVGEQRMASLNKSVLGHSGATDIITLAFRRAGPDVPIVADIYIAPGVARRNAVRHGVPLRQEIARLVVHGVLHALGHEHPDGESSVRERSPMWRRQERLLERAKQERVW